MLNQREMLNNTNKSFASLAGMLRRNAARVPYYGR